MMLFTFFLPGSCFFCCFFSAWQAVIVRGLQFGYRDGELRGAFRGTGPHKNTFERREAGLWNLEKTVAKN
jgi:hypothetical protein